MKRVAKTENEAIVCVPPVARMTIVAIEPTITIVIAFHLEDVEVAVRIGFVQETIYATVF